MITLPQYFLADLPPEARVTPEMIREACTALRRNRRQNLLHRSSASIARTLEAVASEWLRPAFPLRQLALQQGPGVCGLTEPVLARGLDTFFGSLKEASLLDLIRQDLGHPRALDEFVSSPGEASGSGRWHLASGPGMLIHVTAGNLPASALSSLVMGLLAKSAQFLKCASGSSLIPRLFAHSILEVEPKLAACIEIVDWPRGSVELEDTLLGEADTVTVTGSDHTLAALRSRIPVTTRFIGYGHKVSLGYIAADALSRMHFPRVVGRAATDVVAWNQLGCLSPHVFYVQEGGPVSPETFAEALAAELQRMEEVLPRGPLPMEEAGAIQSRRNLYRIRAAHSTGTRMWMSPESTHWTVILEPEPLFQASCLNRFVYVKPVENMEAALRACDPVKGKVSTVGLAAPESAIPDLATQLGRWGVTRVCPLGRMQAPPIEWRHDGRPALGELVTWTDWEG